MAKNWMVSEVAEQIISGVRTEEAQDFGRRFPITSMTIAKALAGDKEATLSFMKSLPDYVTMGKMEKFFKEGATGSSEDGDDSEGTEDGSDSTGATPTKPETTQKPATTSGGTDLESMSKDDLWKLGKSLGVPNKAMNNRENMIKSIREAQAGSAMNAPVGNAKADKADDKKAASDDYSKMGAKDLYKICKERGLEAEQKKPAQYYIDILAADDAKADEDETPDYSKMSAKDLYKLCKDKGIEVEQKKPAQYYIDALNASGKEEESWDEEPADEPKKDDKKPAAGKPAADKGKGKGKEVKEDEWDI